MVNGIVWREGLFIRPQHFQQNDRYHEYLYRLHTIESQPNGWGLYDLEFDIHFLNSGKLVLNRAFGIMPDGSTIDLNIKSHNLIIDTEPSDAGKVIYLAVALDVEGADRICFEEDASHNARFIAGRSKDLPNTNAGENSIADILVTRYNYKLLREEELNEGYCAIGLTKIGAVSVSGSVTLDYGFSPVYLHAHKSVYITAQIKELSNILHFRISKLSEKLSDITIQVAELGDYLMLGLLNRYHTRLHYYLTQERIHPQTLFLELVSLASELTVFLKKDKTLQYPLEYVHKEQKVSFENLFSELKTMLSAVLEQTSIKLPIEQRKYGIHVSKIEDKSLIDTSIFVLAVSSDMVPEKLKKLLLDNLKIGTIETIRDLVNYHLAGFKIRPLPTAPRQIPYRVNHLYFQLEISSEEKRTLHASGGMALHLSGDVSGIEYHLWAVRNSKE